MATGHENIGDALRKGGRTAEAVDSYRQALRIQEEVAAGDPGNADVRAGLTALCRTLAEVDPAAAAVPACQTPYGR